MKARPVQPVRKGFTLIELLVVVSILALLVAIFSPSMERVRRLARSTLCLSHLHEIGVGHHTYSSNFRGYTIPTISKQSHQWWTTSLVPYIGDREVLFCPEATTGAAPVLGTLVIGGRHTTWFDGRQYPSDPLDRGSYGQNMWLNHYGNSLHSWGHEESHHFGGLTSSAPQPGRVPMVGECHWVGGYPYHTDIPWEYEWDGFMLGGHQLNRFTMNRHDGRANLVFLDGDARSVRLGDMWQLIWNKHYIPQYVTLPWAE
jgi:prepilin-type N-terminal cleavage/methylation domain-containing protein/prepilin-type processing-associated H-X9-DG protein